jgi:serine/threonine protein kinase/tetratricopeptide (TPR) repeat protein
MSSLSPPSRWRSDGGLSSTEVDDPVMAEAAALAERLAASWRRGICCRAEEMLAEHPHIAAQPRAAVRVIYEEICQRQERGDEPTLAELQERFPQWHDELAIVLNCHRIMELNPAGPRFPELGEVLGEFRLLAELGRGGMGRVYLAEQTFLAGRLMILKLTACANQEHLKLARLQHTNIVPLYSVRDFAESHLRTLCMPCLGGATLQQLLKTLRSIPLERRIGRDLVDALPRSVADARLYWPVLGPNRRFLEKASYVQAACWIGICLADALHYAHEQGLMHLDVKPSNVLLTADCQPMLLDFHLARAPIQPGEDSPSWLGGTPAYMAPEQHAAWHAIADGRSVMQAIDARCDVYALGLVLRDLLYGLAPESEAVGSPVPLPSRVEISQGLRDILARATAPDPAARYPSAALLAEDLRRHVTHRPLVGVRNRSIAERWHKWRWRRPHALLLSLLILVSLGAGAAIVGLYAAQAAHERRAVEAALAQGRRQLERQHFAEALETFDRALELPAAAARQAELLLGRQRAARGRAAAALHRQMERCRYLHGDALVAPTTLRALAEQCRTAWQERDRLLAADDEPLDAELEERLRRDLLDVAVLWADCQVRLAAPARRSDARRTALQVVEEAEALFGPSAVLSRQRQALGKVLDRTAPAPRTAWEHYQLGRWLLGEGDLAAAAAAFERAVELRPQDFWPWFGKGTCAHRRGRAAEAVTAFSVCIALAPQTAVCYHNRALARSASDPAAALRDYDQALTLDPHLAEAALNRGVLHLEQRRFRQAEADLRLALTLGADPATVQHNLALVQEARQVKLREDR